MTAQLNEYNQKRNFEKTIEPEGKTVDSDESLRFVVQHHLASRDHFDFRLEWNGILLSWQYQRALHIILMTKGSPFMWRTTH